MTDTALVKRDPGGLPRLQAGEVDPLTLARVFAQSGYFADAKEAAQAAVKILAGQELGVPAVAAMTGVFLLQGRVTLSANLVAAVIKRSGRYTYRVLELTDTACRLAFLEQGEPIGESVFTQKDAENAGLWGKDQWKKYPRNLLFARALTNGARWHCPDIFVGGVYTAEELGGEVEEAARAPVPAVYAAAPADPPAEEEEMTGDELAERFSPTAALKATAREIHGRMKQIKPASTVTLPADDDPPNVWSSWVDTWGPTLAEYEAKRAKAMAAKR